jgi:hypothetical protein
MGDLLKMCNITEHCNINLLGGSPWWIPLVDHHGGLADRVLELFRVAPASWMFGPWCVVLSTKISWKLGGKWLLGLDMLALGSRVHLARDGARSFLLELCTEYNYGVLSDLLIAFAVTSKPQIHSPVLAF